MSRLVVYYFILAFGILWITRPEILLFASFKESFNTVFDVKVNSLVILLIHLLAFSIFPMLFIITNAFTLISYRKIQHFALSKYIKLLSFSYGQCLLKNFQCFAFTWLFMLPTSPKGYFFLKQSCSHITSPSRHLLFFYLTLSLNISNIYFYLNNITFVTHQIVGENPSATSILNAFRNNLSSYAFFGCLVLYHLIVALFLIFRHLMIETAFTEEYAVFDVLVFAFMLMFGFLS